MNKEGKESTFSNGETRVNMGLPKVIVKGIGNASVAVTKYKATV